MTENNLRQCWLNLLPSEVLSKIFMYLSAKQLSKCRQVCVRWRNEIDELLENDRTWRFHCIQDFGDLYKIAHYKARAGVNSKNIYISLTLWPKLAQARETIGEFAVASGVAEEIMDFHILQDGIIGIHHQNAIVYYDIETLKPSERKCYTGNYLKYMENANCVVVHNFHQHLFILRKKVHRPYVKTNRSFDRVKTWLLVGSKVYYADCDEEIYVVDLDSVNLDYSLISKSLESILCMSYSKNKLNILTHDRNIYSVVDDNLFFQCALESTNSLVHVLKEYNFLENLDWQVYLKWTYIMDRTVPDGPQRDITVVFIYGETVFIGTKWGMLYIFHNDNDSGEFDLFKSEPIKQYNLIEKEVGLSKFQRSPILKIDILESEYGHIVIAAMPKKLVVLKFEHFF